MKKFFILFLLGINYFSFKGYGSDQEDTLRFFTYNVGQGSCHHFRVGEENIFVDCGSSEYANPIAYHQASSISDPCRSPQPHAASAPQSVYRKRGPNPQDLKSANKGKPEQLKRELFETIRKNCSAEENQDVITIKTVVITHPDKDHYGWLNELFTNDTIEHIILGGLPCDYKLQNFRDWLYAKVINKTVLYLPAVLGKPFQGDIDDLKKLFEQDSYNDYAYQPSFHGSMENSIYQEAFNIQGLNVSCLGLNTMHGQHFGKTFRFLNHGETNGDSIALKFEYKGQSVTCLGDMEGVNLNFLLAAWENNLDRLKTTVLVSSHHGALEKDCNDENFLKVCAPSIVVFSHGSVHGHPRIEVYETLKKINCAAPLGEEKGIYWGTKMETKSKRDKDYTRYQSWSTTHAYFGTLYDGNIEMELGQDSIVTVNTQKNDKSYRINIASKEIALQPDAFKEQGVFIENKFVPEDPVIEPKIINPISFSGTLEESSDTNEAEIDEIDEILAQELIALHKGTKLSDLRNFSF